MRYTNTVQRSFGSIAPIFRGPFLQRIANGTHVAALLELADYYADFNPPPTTAALGEWFDHFYQLLFERYRCEYVYKNVIATRIFLSRHSLHNSYATDELRSGNSRADVVILNGTSTVYEIKSDFDSFDRLDNQLSDYRRIFDYIYVVTSKARVSSVMRDTSENVGVLAMREDGALSPLRAARSNKANTDPASIFDCMRRAEYCRALTERFGEVPEVPNSMIYRVCRELFCTLPPTVAHDLMVKNVKTRASQNPFAGLIEAIPQSLKHACINFSKSRAMADVITEKLNSPFV